ncbi:Arginine N-succinyltransferase [Poriferisphaera corsica]|uniref:Arginine N-succinyltransferase n=1 Tax=Poriferisphaera corsica TaxID=2528020 RepID=A0A517YXT3_9BACT|nr:arginine N-succinyltransferase [Poriferisphaera corsica]QDU35040.1 Arginine N-succinyltransferase [Poriferisphaera corsica]
MVIIRPIERHDTEQFVDLVSKADFGMTSLTKDPDYLAKRVEDSIRGFERIDYKPTPGEAFMFVMEDLETSNIVGTSGIVPKVGGFEPFYAFRTKTGVQRSDFIGVQKEIRTLHPYAEHNGPCEICSLFLDESYRSSGNGRLLSLSRFLFMSEHPTHFDPEIIAALRGVIDPNGRSPFYDALSQHFFDIDFLEASRQSVFDKSFVGDLMPKHPIYVATLPKAAQEVIGEVHRNTVPARRLLEQEGFIFSGLIDIFEAGPIYTCQRNKIRTLRESSTVIVDKIAPTQNTTTDYIIASNTPSFRSGKAYVDFSADEHITLDPQIADALRLSVGDNVRVAPIRPAFTQKTP